MRAKTVARILQAVRMMEIGDPRSEANQIHAALTAIQEDDEVLMEIQTTPPEQLAALLHVCVVAALAIKETLARVGEPPECWVPTATVERIAEYWG